MTAATVIVAEVRSALAAGCRPAESRADAGIHEVADAVSGCAEAGSGAPLRPVLDSHQLPDRVWWVDTIRRSHPDTVAPAIRKWARDSDQWRRHASVICHAGP